MSRQSEAKLAMGYRTTPKTCGNCGNFHSEKLILPGYGLGVTYIKERSLTCIVGNFAVKKMATCDRWVAA